MPREHNNSSDMRPLAANCTRFYHVLQKQGLPATLQTQVLLQPLDGGEIIASQWAECGRLPWRPGLAGGSGAAPRGPRHLTVQHVFWSPVPRAGSKAGSGLSQGWRTWKKGCQSWPDRI